MMRRRRRSWRVTRRGFWGWAVASAEECPSITPNDVMMWTVVYIKGREPAHLRHEGFYGKWPGYQYLTR